MTFIMRKKKYKFSVTITVEQLNSVPFMNEVLFVKCRLLNGGSFVDYTDRVEVVDHCVKWNKCFVFTCKMSANASTGILESCILRLSLRKETKDGKSYDKLGYHDLNLSSFPGAGLTNCRCLLEGYESRHHRQDNSLLHFKVDMKLLAGDPCGFKTPNFNCLTENHKQGSNDFLLESELISPNINNGSIDPPSEGLLGATDADALHLHSNLTLHNSNANLITNSQNTNSTGSNSNSVSNPFYHMDPMTSSATSNTNSVGSAFEPFETGHSCSNSSQTSSSRMSAGYNSLPSHSRQGSADSENNVNSRYQNEIKFNSVDRVGNKRNTKQTNGGLNDDLYLIGSSKRAIDSTRISADQIVQELLKTNKLDEPTISDSTFTHDTNGCLELYVSSDGSATIGSRSGKSGSAYPVRTNSSPSTTANSRTRYNRVN